MIRLGLGLLLASFPPAPVHPAEANASFTVSLDHNTVSLGESVRLTLTFEGQSPQSRPNIPPIPNLKLEYVGASEDATYKDGNLTRRVSLNYMATALEPGDYLIPEISAAVGGQLVTAGPVRLKVLRADDLIRAADGGKSPAFLRLLPPDGPVYVGQVFPVEISLYVQHGMGSDLRMPQLQADGFTLGQPVQTGQSQSRIGQTAYVVLGFQIAATPAKAGTLVLGPVECDLVLNVPTESSSRSGPGISFFFRQTESRSVRLRSEKNSIQVHPLPTKNRPPTFNGAVGRFAIAGEAGPTNLAVGDPITFRVRISGQGPLNSIAFPPQPDWKDFKTYPPTSRVQFADKLGMSGSKVFEQVVIPEREDIRQLPSLAFSFFDPEAGRYQTLRTDPFPLQVQPNAAGLSQPTVFAEPAAPAEEQEESKDIVHIKPTLGTLGPLQAPLIFRPWFLALQTVPLLAWLGAMLQRKRREHLSRNPRLRRRHQVERTIQAGLRDLNRYASADESDQFFATVFRLLQERLGERLDLPASAITEAVIDERLRNTQIPEPLLDRLEELFQLCNLARYAPIKSRQELLSLTPKVGETLAKLGEFDLSEPPGK